MKFLMEKYFFDRNSKNNQIIYFHYAISSLKNYNLINIPITNNKYTIDNK